MLEFFRDAEYGAILLFVAGTLGYWTATSIGARRRARSPETAQPQEASQRVFHARFVTFGMVVCGLTWWVIRG